MMVAAIGYDYDNMMYYQQYNMYQAIIYILNNLILIDIFNVY